jgi:eukaryotic-like serine/threonine-protein kinase
LRPKWRGSPIAYRSAMIGQSLGHYRIEAELGSGGMGVVYRAHDTKLGRTVAIKLVGERFAAEPTARERLMREARTASALNHPHICTIHEVGESDGHVYIVMEHVEGRPLSALPHAERPTGAVLRYGIQIADALAHAHQRGIVHRDLKTNNVIVSPEGRTKVLDFGLAKRLPAESMSAETLPDEVTRSTDSLTEPGQIAGTLHYLAPEVLRGQPADRRADIWCLGVLLYELAAGDMPFRGKTRFEVTHAILGEAPQSLPASVPGPLRSVILRCLAKEPAQRYQAAAEVRAALEAVQSGTYTSEPIPSPPRSSRWLLIGVPVVLLIVGGLTGLRFLPSAGPDIDSIAVLPFANVGGNPDAEYLSDGVTDNLIGSLSRLPRLKVIAFASVARYKGRSVDPQEVVKDLGVAAALFGRVAPHGDKLSISAELIDTRDKSRLWGEQYDVKPGEISSVQQQISTQISSRLRRQLTGDAEERASRRYSSNAEAYDLYLKARYYSQKSTLADYQKGIEFARRAIEKDPGFAPAYAALARIYGSMTWEGLVSPKDGHEQMNAAVTKALKLDDSLGDAYFALGALRWGRDWDFAGAEDALRRSIALDPKEPLNHQHYANFLRSRGRWDEALDQMKQAQTLDPLGSATNNALAFLYYHARRWDEAIEQATKTLEIDPKFAAAHELLAEAYARKGMHQEAIAEQQQAFVVSGDQESADGLGADFKALGYDEVMRQQYQATLDGFKEAAKAQYVSPMNFAMTYAKLGDKDAAFAWLEKAFAERSPWVVFLNEDPDFDDIRSDPRFAALVKRIGLS